MIHSLLAQIAEVAVNGMLLGSLLSLVAIGISLTFGVSGLLNIAHGEFIVMAGIASYMMFLQLSLNPLAIALIVPLIFFLIGIAFEKGMVKRMVSKKGNHSIAASILVTFGLALIIQDVSTYFVGAVPKGIQVYLKPIDLGFLKLSSIKLIALMTVTSISLALWSMLKFTKVGRSARALIQDRVGAILCGVDVDKISTMIVGLGISVAGIAGFFYAVVYTVQTTMGLSLTLVALLIAVLGGLGNVLGTLMAGIAVGVAHSLASFFLGQEWSVTLSMAMLLAVLTLRPTGMAKGFEKSE